MTNPLENHPDLWRASFPWPKPDGHKYDRGHAVVLGGPMASAGAAKLASRAALRSGAGLVSVACRPAALMTYAASLQAVMTKLVKDVDAFAELIADAHVTGVLLGPGAGKTDFTKQCVLSTLTALVPCVLDADALSVFAGASESLFDAIAAPCILTPHAGEFARLFTLGKDRQASAAHAATLSGAVVVLKGEETVIAAPNGQGLVINRHATPFLASAGTGDVLAGLCVGLLAQGMPPFAAACAAVWLHGDAARRIGPGLIAEDLSEMLPAVLADLFRG